MTVKDEKLIKGTDIGLSGDDQIKIALKRIISLGGKAEMKDIYEAVEEKLDGCKLSDQGKASLRFFINKVAVQAELVYPHDKNEPGWRITPAGKEYVLDDSPTTEHVVNVDSNIEQEVTSNSARGYAFEQYILKLLKAMYPNFVWYHQGVHKKHERGLDFIGNALGLDNKNESNTIGVQVKFHQSKHIPSETEWLKFLSGCFSHRVDLAVFITTGSMSGEQMRQAREANVLVIQGIEEVKRVSKQYKTDEFELFNDDIE